MNETQHHADKGLNPDPAPPTDPRYNQVPDQPSDDEDYPMYAKEEQDQCLALMRWLVNDLAVDTGDLAASLESVRRPTNETTTSHRTKP